MPFNYDIASKNIVGYFNRLAENETIRQELEFELEREQREKEKADTEKKKKEQNVPWNQRMAYTQALSIDPSLRDVDTGNPYLEQIRSQTAGTSMEKPVEADPYGPSVDYTSSGLDIVQPTESSIKAKIWQKYLQEGEISQKEQQAIGVDQKKTSEDQLTSKDNEKIAKMAQSMAKTPYGIDPNKVLQLIPVVKKMLYPNLDKKQPLNNKTFPEKEGYVRIVDPSTGQRGWVPQERLMEVIQRGGQVAE